jgi:hypothetical protein
MENDRDLDVVALVCSVTFRSFCLLITLCTVYHFLGVDRFLFFENSYYSPITVFYSVQRFSANDTASVVCTDFYSPHPIEKYIAVAPSIAG